MNKKSTYGITLLLFLLAVIFIFFRYKNTEKNKANTFYELKPRSSFLAASPEWASTQTRASQLYKAINDDPDDLKSRVSLAGLFVQEARITGNYMYYDRAAMQQTNNVLKKDPNNFEALTLKALIYLSQHHFADGLTTARQIEKLYSYNAFNYGILVDANVEMGDYPAAVASAEKMVSIRPDLRSYSRISYLREIHGDNAGAIEAMKSAVDAGMPTEEGTEWCRVQLGHLYENIGDLKSAEMHYTIALNERPSYAYAMAGLGRIAIANNNYPQAIELFQKADSIVNDYSFKEQLVQLYNKTGQQDKAKKILEEVIDGMNEDAQKGQTDESIGHYADRELANAYLLKNDYDKALEHALAEYNRRPENIDVNETVAWVYYKKGEIKNALQYLATALNTKCKNPTLLCHAGLINAKAGNKELAKNYLIEGLKDNPNIDVDLKSEAVTVLKHYNY